MGYAVLFALSSVLNLCPRFSWFISGPFRRSRRFCPSPKIPGVTLRALIHPRILWWPGGTEPGAGDHSYFDSLARPCISHHG
jgi:hypothetical protein